MNESQRRHLLMTFHHVDHLLSEAERILAAAPAPGPFQEYTPDATPDQRAAVQDYAGRVREAMRRILDQLGIPPKPPISGTVWAARNHLAFASLAIVEIGPKQMKAYGEVSEADRQTLNQIAAELNELLSSLDRRLSHSATAGTPAETKPADKP